jgi:hypothetical protein
MRCVGGGDRLDADCAAEMVTRTSGSSSVDTLAEAQFKFIDETLTKPAP